MMNTYTQNSVQYIQSIRPVGVTILAVLTYIAGTLLLIGGLGLLVVGVEFFHQASKFSRFIDLRFGGEVVILLALLHVGLGIFNYILGTSLLKLKNWARITLIVLTSIQLFFLFISFVFSIKALALSAVPLLISLISIGLCLWVIIYLNNNNVRAAFGTYFQSHVNNRENYLPQTDYQPDRISTPASGYSGEIVVVKGTNQGKKITLYEGKNYIGRDPSCSIYLPDPEKYVSRRHCVIICKPDVVGIVHLSEKGSTYVNGEKIFKKKLFNGDLIKAGKYVLRLVTI